MLSAFHHTGLTNAAYDCFLLEPARVHVGMINNTLHIEVAMPSPPP
jgi:hypothetical protein